MVLRLSLTINSRAAVCRISVALSSRCIVDWGFVDSRSLASLPLLMESFEGRYAPVAPRPSAEAVGKLACHCRPFNFKIGLHFSKTYTKAQADMIIGIHRSMYRYFD